MRRGWVIVGVIAIGGCASSPRATQFRRPDGAMNWWHLACQSDQSGCLRLAGDRCPSAYDVVDRSGQVGSRSTSTATQIGASTVVTGQASAMLQGEMVVRCNGESAAAPVVDPRCATTPLHNCS